MGRFCQECGYLLNDTDSVCPECGSRNSRTVTSTELKVPDITRKETNQLEFYEPVVRRNNNTKSFPWLILVAAIVVLSGIAGGVVYYFKSQSPHEEEQVLEDRNNTGTDNNLLTSENNTDTTDNDQVTNNSETHEQEKVDNSWLIGKWGPVIANGGAFSDIIESITTEIDIIDDHTLIEISRTKLTPLGIATAKSRGTYKGDVTESKETADYTVDNENNELIYNSDPEKQNRQAYEMRLPFDKTNQTLNFGSEEKSEYLRKQNNSK